MKLILRTVFAILLVAACIAAAWIEGIRAGADKVLPGPMNRHRDAIAIAMTWTAYGDWHGYAAYKRIVQTLNDAGLSIHSDKVTHTGLRDYFEVMRAPKVLDAALARAASVENVEAGGLYFLNDEKGMSLFYALAFKLFGHQVASFFHTYMGLLSLAAFAFFAAFWRRQEALFVLVCVLLAEGAIIVVCQHLEPDVNAIHSGRFLAALSAIPALHLLLLMVYRERFSLAQFAAALVQTLLLIFVLNARGSAIWQLIPLVGLGAWRAFEWARRRFVVVGPARPIAGTGHGMWILALVVMGLIALRLHAAYAYHPRFYQPDGTVTHIFWHSLTTALHNNPKRTEKFGIDAGIPTWDDVVVHELFKRVIARRGEPLSAYLRNDGEWRLRTSDPSFDFVWPKYESVVRDLFLDAVASHPGYTLQSFLLYQTRDTVKTLARVIMDHVWRILSPIAAALLALGVLLFSKAPALPRETWGWIGVTLACSAMPTYASAVIPLRVTDLLLISLVVVYLAIGEFARGVLASRLGSVTHSRSSEA